MSPVPMYCREREKGQSYSLNATAVVGVIDPVVATVALVTTLSVHAVTLVI